MAEDSRILPSTPSMRKKSLEEDKIELTEQDFVHLAPKPRQSEEFTTPKRHKNHSSGQDHSSGHGRKGWKNGKYNHYKKLPPEPNNWELTPEFDAHLTRAMEDVYTRLLPTGDGIKKRLQFRDKLQSIFDEEWPDKEIKAHLFGSSVNGLGTIYSDVDICLITLWDDKLRGVSNMYVLAQVLKKHGMVRIKPINSSKVPICKFADPEFGLACDINVNQQISLQNTELIRSYVAIDPRVRPLIMIVKHWAKCRVLNDAGMGGTLSSYCWVNLVLHFLQTRNPPILPSLQAMYEGERQTVDGVDTSFYRDIDKLHHFGNANKETLGQLLFRFFKRYAIEFDYARHVVSVRTGKTLTKAEKGWNVIEKGQVNFFCVEEPFFSSRNLGNSADKISVDGLRQEFMRGLLILKSKGDLDALCEQYIKPMPIIPPAPEVYFEHDGETVAPSDEPSFNLDLPRKHHRSTSAPGNTPVNPYLGSYNRFNARFSENMDHNLAYGQIYAGYQAPAGMAAYAQYWEQQRLLAQSQAKPTKESFDSYYPPVVYLPSPYVEGDKKDREVLPYPAVPMHYYPGYMYVDENGMPILGPMGYPVLSSDLYAEPLVETMKKMDIADLESDDEPIKDKRKKKQEDEDLTSQSGTILHSHDESGSNRGTNSTPSPGIRPERSLESLDELASNSSGHTASRDDVDKPTWSAVAQAVAHIKAETKEKSVENIRVEKNVSVDLFNAKKDDKKSKKKKNKDKRRVSTSNIPQEEKKGKRTNSDSALPQKVGDSKSWASLVARGKS